MKIAIVHDQIQEFGGAERVLVALKQIFPEADVFTSFYNPEALGMHAKLFEGWNIKTSWADRVPFFKKLFSPLRFLTPLIWESFNFNGYDVVISSSGWYMSKGIITRPETKHICYLHHQPRYLYYYETAVEWQKYWPVKIYAHIVNHKLRMWDYISSQRPDYFIANSEETKKRIKKFYRREDVTVVYPPVNIPDDSSTNYQLSTTNYYITTSRLAKAKHIDILIKAANKYKFNLKIIGKGRDEEYLKSMAAETVEFLTNVSDEQFKEIYQGAKAFLFASVDDEFGIAPIEAMGYGIPVIAYSSGGLKETVKDGTNGYLYHDLNEDSLLEKIKQLENLSEEEYKTMKINSRKEAEKYSFEEFKKKIIEFIESIK
jgi:glycosyltransferase involved in cell wall biosynthesis